MGDLLLKAWVYVCWPFALMAHQSAASRERSNEITLAEYVRRMKTDGSSAIYFNCDGYKISIERWDFVKKKAATRRPEGDT